MDDANGSVETGNPEAPNAAAVEGSNGAGESTWTGLQDADNLSFVEAKGWKAPDDAIKSYKELESRLGKAVTLPADDDDSPERFDKIASKMGWPEKPDGYEFKLDADAVPEGMPYNEEFATEFRSFAHDNRLTAAQAAAAHDWFVKSTAGQFQAGQEETAQAAVAREAQEAEQHRAIVAEWGKPDSAGYKEGVSWADRALRETGLHEDFQRAGLIGQDGAVLSAKAAFALRDIGKKLYGEDGTGNPLAKAEAMNPFAGETANRTEQGRLIRLAKEDPSQREGVVRLVRQAGKDPASLGLG